jgi:hypothetical protein
MLLGTRSRGQAGRRKASVEPGTAGGRQSETNPQGSRGDRWQIDQPGPRYGIRPRHLCELIDIHDLDRAPARRKVERLSEDTGDRAETRPKRAAIVIRM